ncbi:hypothetical protein IP88_13185 [alpha proteobacterium AAP81b]|nr:hypothetical protein IP88_13185 [alpha proteobacterium AAP81b]
MRFVLLALAFASAAVAAPIATALPGDLTPYPALKGGPSPEAINNNCLSCHSADMAMTQPRLSEAEWRAEVAKMRGVFKAPIDPADDAAIVAWLTEWSRRLPAG